MFYLEYERCQRKDSNINQDSMQEDTCSERRGLIVDLDFGGCCFTFCLEILMVLLPWPPKGGNLHFILFGDILSWVILGWLSSKWRKRLPTSRYVQECPSQSCNQLWFQLVISQDFVTDVLGALWSVHRVNILYGSMARLLLLFITSSLLYPCSSTAKMTYPKIFSSVLNIKTKQQLVQLLSVLC